MQEMVEKMAVFILCAGAIIHFRPKAVYEKYLKLLLAAMFLVQMLQFLLVLGGGREQDFLVEQMRESRLELEEGMSKVYEQAQISEQRLVEESEKAAEQILREQEATEADVPEAEERIVVVPVEQVVIGGHKSE